MTNKSLLVALILLVAGAAMVLNSFSISCPLSKGGISCRADENCRANCSENCSDNSSENCICPADSACRENGSDENCSGSTASCAVGSGYKGHCSGR